MSKTTVANLIKKLQEFPANKQVGMSSDDEGNSYSPYIYPEEHNNLVILYPSGMYEIDDFDDYVSDESE